MRRSLSQSLRSEVVKRQKNVCNKCLQTLRRTKDGIPLFDIDHIEMHCINQDDSIENLQALCLVCHREKTVREIRNNRRTMREERVTEELKINRFREFMFDIPSKLHAPDVFNTPHYLKKESTGTDNGCKHCDTV